ncbi:MAG TPA: tRNA-binding protein [Candidatus Nanoarchaeia archaeon]|nr:tRNA-binding protein [Candidatus Nanoarchaeia archaeon]
MKKISWDDFEGVELRAGTVTRVEDFPEAKIPAYKIWVNFGKEICVKKSSAQITKLYKKDELIGKQIIGVVNFPQKQIANFISEFLTTGFVSEDGKVVLAQPERKVDNGAKLA